MVGISSELLFGSSGMDRYSLPLASPSQVIGLSMRINRNILTQLSFLIVFVFIGLSAGCESEPSDADTESTSTCVLKERCVDNRDCLSGSQCNTESSFCQTLFCGQSDASCSTDAHCNDGLICLSGMCSVRPTEGEVCTHLRALCPDSNCDESKTTHWNELSDRLFRCWLRAETCDEVTACH